MVEVEVDTGTGKTDVVGIWAAHDSGKVIFPQGAYGQVYGGIAQGLGYALSEKFELEDGINITTTLNQLKMPLADQTPEIIPVLVEVPHPDGPQGAKGFAESPSLPTAPAILNAVYDAVGVRMRDLPADNKKILAALKERTVQDSFLYLE